MRPSTTRRQMKRPVNADPFRAALFICNAKLNPNRKEKMVKNLPTANTITRSATMSSRGERIMMPGLGGLAARYPCAQCVMMMPNSATARSTSTTAMRSLCIADPDGCCMNQVPREGPRKAWTQSPYSQLTPADPSRVGESGPGFSAHFLERHAGRQLQQFELRLAIRPLEYREVGNQHVHAVRAGEG